MYKEIFEELLKEHGDKTAVFKRNVLKEYLQVLCLAYIYSIEEYQKSLAFYGGSCLKHCYGLNRLSEDLDFVNIGDKKIDKESLAEKSREYLKKSLGVDLSFKIQQFRIYLKFPILKNIGLVGASESDLLFLKLEIFEKDDFLKGAEIEVIPVFKHGKTVFVRSFNLSIMMATKINAVLNRKWEKGVKDSDSFISVKGRDYYDLLWYLSRGIRPDIKFVKDCDNMAELKSKLNEIIKKIDSKSIALDLEGLIGDSDSILDASRNIKDVLIQEIENKL